MWQSMKMSGTLSRTQERMGGPMVMFGTKLLGYSDRRARSRDRKDAHPSMTSSRRYQPRSERCAELLTHVEPVGAVRHHPPAFRGEVGQVALVGSALWTRCDGEV